MTYQGNPAAEGAAAVKRDDEFRDALHAGNMMNIDTSRSYTKEAKLHEAVRMYFKGDGRYMTVCNRQGRFTAIFPIAWNKNLMPVWIAQRGFMVVG